MHGLVCLLFLSRLVPKYFHYRSTDQVHLLGHVWEGGSGLLVLMVIAIITVVLLVSGIKNIRNWFSSRQDQE